MTETTLCISQEVKWLTAAPNTFFCFQPPCSDSESLGLEAVLGGRQICCVVHHVWPHGQRRQNLWFLALLPAMSHVSCFGSCACTAFLLKRGKTALLEKAPASQHFCLVFISHAVAKLGVSCRPQSLAGRLRVPVSCSAEHALHPPPHPCSPGSSHVT